MYGMVNSAVKKMITEKLGEETWLKICESIGLGNDSFDSFSQYPDEVTGSIVVELSKITDTSVDELLTSFGRYWIEYAQESEYSAILESAGNSPEGLIESLDQMHTRLEMIFEKLKAPSFSITKLENDELYVHYYSDRKLPLEAFVIGLIEGIYTMYGLAAEVAQIDPKGDERACFYVKRK